MAPLPIPGGSCCEILPGLFFLSIARELDDCPEMLACTCADGLLRSEGLLRVRKLCDLALRILGRPWEVLDVDEGPFNLC